MQTAVEEGRGGPAARLAGWSRGPCEEYRLCCRRGSRGLPAGPPGGSPTSLGEADGNRMDLEPEAV